MRHTATHRAAILAAALGALIAARTAPAQEHRGSASAPTAPPSGPPADLTVRFRERAIDLRPYFEGFPYLRFRAEYDDRRLFYFRDGRGVRELWTLRLEDGQDVSLERGTRVGTVDWNTRGLRSMLFHAPSNQYVVIADAANEERWNLFFMSAETGALDRLTDHPYVYGYGLDKQQRYVGYVARFGAGQPYRSCLRLLEVPTRRDHEVLCDSPEVTFTWTDVNFRPDGTGAVIDALHESDRNRQNLVYIDLTTTPPTQRTLLDASTRRRNVATVREWLDANRFVYTSDESGFTNVYVFDLATNASRQVTRLTEDVDDVVALTVAASAEETVPPAATRFLLGAMVKRPYESELLLVDPESGDTLARHTFDATATFLDYAGGRAMVQQESRRTRFSLDELGVVPAAAGAPLAFTVVHRAGVPEDVSGRIEQCNVERVSIPTFDTDPRTGRPRALHAYLQTPRAPARDPARRFAVIEAFYGGENEFDTASQIYCEAGGIVLSPAVRGSSGFGAEFSALNDHDLGGNEVHDLMAVGRWLTERFHISQRQVGLFGGSHGGYEVMRAVTFPPEVNGRRDHFDWGFGVSYFGFSNILTFYETCNIPDWVLLEAGNPRTERDRLLDRSPVTHAARATAPLLLLHGENDQRVPVRESRQMAEALRRARRSVTYVEFSGQGHGLKGVANQHRVWTSVLGFIERTLDARGGTLARPTGRHRGRRAAWWLVAGGLLAAALGAGVWASRDR